MQKIDKKRVGKQNIFELLKSYILLVILLIFLTLIANGLNLFVPKIISTAIDTYSKSGFIISNIIIEFFLVILAIFIFSYLQSLVQIYASERVARDIRKQFVDKVSVQEYSYINKITPEKLLTNLTSDIDAIKIFVSQALVSIISSVFLIIGASIMLLLIDWKLALAVLAIMPLIAITFFFISTKVTKLFKRSQEAIDWLNKIIHESIFGASLIRILNAEQIEAEKFLAANTEAKSVSMSILRLFSSLMPIISFLANIATLIVVSLGGYFVINGAMTLGNFTAFNSYISILIFPIILLGFMSSAIAQSNASYNRILEVLNAPKEKDNGTLITNIKGDINVNNISVRFGEKEVVKNVSFNIKAGSKTAIIGPTAAGKTQLLYVLTGLLKPTSGNIQYDDKDINNYEKSSFHGQVGFVFQDSIVFNMTLRENIAFSNTVDDESLKKAIDTSELNDFIEALPNKLDTIVSERGTSLSGGQKQRIMLARALALNPKVLFLDDFTARVDTMTEQKIIENIDKNYPNLTLISIAQKIASVDNYDKIILLMEGELLAMGTHEKLMKTSPEYVQIYKSQRSINTYELQA
ncbi:MAG TPA: ABC transporter ATP-binding protein [Candidatus Pacearchaeota archaeon]|nr:ABC transporter ATP-binding protein [Candidatus Pacearchaeota archaeon]HPR80117.1 ABC transporter ATP-binding protein [Candidatus Pacearchaeota archaeon]